MKCLICLIVVLAAPAMVFADDLRRSSDYGVTAEILDAGGNPITSVDYHNAASIGGNGDFTSSLNYQAVSGFPAMSLDSPKIADWRSFYFGNATGNTGNLEDFDGDGVNNLFEFAFGTLPNANASGGALLQYVGTLAGSGTLAAAGQPITRVEAIPTGVDFRALFVRRKDYAAAGLSYTPQFSANLSTWQNSAAVPTVLADDGTYQIVSVPYPPFIAGRKARFFQLSVNLAP